MITLAKPFEHGGKQYASMDIDEPTIAGLEAFFAATEKGANQLTAMVEMLAVDTGWPAGAIRKIKASDFRRISEAFTPFVEAQTEDSGPTGDPSAPTSPTS